ncbi:ribonuclease H-like domain-containing protein [Tanacetum coccineum]|uniref:Ribonuclease H-like domain-containing protein n=1 Tax=Tanacetum coccineum TaxID=301880 RepID=A0ABQ5CGQ9_9ASTR
MSTGDLLATLLNQLGLNNSSAANASKNKEVKPSQFPAPITNPNLVAYQAFGPIDPSYFAPPAPMYGPALTYIHAQARVPSGQATVLPHAFTVGSLHDLTTGAWNMDTGVSSHLNDSVTNLSEFFNSCMYPSVSVGDDHSIPVTNTGHTHDTPPHIQHIHVAQQTPEIDHEQPPTAQTEIPPLIIPNPPENLNPDSVHPMVMRFRVRTNRPTERLNLHVSSVSPLSKSYRDAFSDPNWQNVVRDEYSALIKNRTWVLVPRPTDTNIVRCMWLFRHKHLADGTLSRYKARLVANASSQPLLQRIIASLHQEFSMTDLGALNYFLGISVTRDSSGMFLSQKKYAVEILERAHMANCNPCRTPVDTESKLGNDGDPVSDPTLYWNLAGSLQYLTFTRPDISYAVQQVCLHMHDPREPHFSALKRILRYVRGTLDYGLQLFSSSTTSLVAYSDADWAGCPTTRRSTSGYCVFLGNNLLSWSAKRQPTLSRSSGVSWCCQCKSTEVTTGSVMVPTGSVIVTTGSVMVPTGSVMVPTGSVMVPTGSVMVPTGSVIVTTGSVIVTPGSVIPGVLGGTPVTGVHIFKLLPGVLGGDTVLETYFFKLLPGVLEGDTVIGSTYLNYCPAFLEGHLPKKPDTDTEKGSSRGHKVSKVKEVESEEWRRLLLHQMRVIIVIVPTSRYVVPTGRVKVPTSRYVVPTGRVKVPTGRVKVPTGRVKVPAGRSKSYSAAVMSADSAVTYTSVHSEARSWSIPSEDPYEEAARQLTGTGTTFLTVTFSAQSMDEAPTPLLPPYFFSPWTPSLLPIPPPAPSASRRAEIPEADTPPRKRLLLTTPRPSCEVGESSAAAAADPPPKQDLLWAHEVDCMCCRHYGDQDHAAVRAEIEVLRRERLAYEQESIQTRQDLARSEAYCRALEARVTVLETEVHRHEWQRSDAVDLVI